MPRLQWISLALLALACNKPPPRVPSANTSPRVVASNELRPVSDFAFIKDNNARAQALFTESARVLLHPRCVNCHPDGDAPLQGMNFGLHDPPVERGVHSEHGDNGIPALACTNCHQTTNLALSRVPGAPKWALAPREMAWQNRTPSQICEQIKDPAKNGNKTLAQIVEHIAKDELVGWAWNPGDDREPAPGTQAQLGALMQSWADLGAACPPEEKKTP
jgi:hypothetical protein